MKKIVKIISVGLIAAAILFLLHFVLTLHAVDIWLTGKIVKNTPEKRSLIYTEWADAEYGIEETDKPCIFVREDRLMLAVGTETADITPEGINIAYYGGFTDFSEMIRYKKNCVVSEDGRYIVYRLEFNEIPYLYYFDTVAQKAFFISDRVDSFDILENDGTEALTLIYATATRRQTSCFCTAPIRRGRLPGRPDSSRKTIKFPVFLRRTAVSFI